MLIGCFVMLHPFIMYIMLPFRLTMDHGLNFVSEVHTKVAGPDSSIINASAAGHGDIGTGTACRGAQ
jgi:hypothetical protein